MDPETVSLLCRPETHEPFRLVTTDDADGNAQEFLVGIQSGEKFLVRDGIPLLLEEASISGFNKQYQGFYNRAASVYDTIINLVARIAGGGEEHFRRQYLQRLQIHDGSRILEVSIGTGANLHYIQSKVKYFGVDISWGMLKRCQKNMRQWQLDAELILGNAEELPLVDESFDSILHVGGINAFNDPAKAIREMVRVARPGSMIMIVDETAKMMESMAWMPSAKKWLENHRERFSPPVGLLPEGMKQIETWDIAKGNIYCLSFIKP